MVETDYTGVVLDGRYRVGAKLGQGGMGTVYVAEHVGLAQPRAIKFLRVDLARKPGAVQRFLQEARVLSGMRHDNLVGVVDMGEHDGSAYYVMDLLTGEDLRGRLRRQGGLGWPQTRAIALQVCAALRLTHARGVVHRDLKPENCFCVDADDGAAHIKLLDFGVAKVPREAGGASQLTGAGEMLGTIGYMAPEQLEGQGDRRADIYSLGAMMFEMLAGRPLHTGNAYEILARMLLAPAPALASVCAVDPAIDLLIATAVARDPADRFTSMDAFAAAIAEIPATAAPQTFDRPAAPCSPPAGETTADGAPALARVPVTAAPGPGDMSSSPGVSAPARRAHDPAASDPRAFADTLAPDTPAPKDSQLAALSPVPQDSSRAAPPPVLADSSVTPLAPAPTDSAPAPARSRLAPVAAALLAAVIAWQVWPAGDAPTSPPAASASAPAPVPPDSPHARPVPAPSADPSAPAQGPDGPVPSASLDATSERPVPSASLEAAPDGPVPSASPDAAPERPVPSASPGATPEVPVPGATAARPGKPPRDAGKPSASARPLSREALRARLARELAACGSPYVAEEIAVRVTPGKAGKLAGLAAIADDRLAAGTVACLERELARVQAGLIDSVDAARAFDVSLTLPRRGG